MAGQKRPTNITSQAVVSQKSVTPLASSSTVAVPTATATAPFANTSTATSNTFDTLNTIRVNNLGGLNSAGIFAGIDKSQGFFDINLKSFSVSGDLEITETPSGIILGIKAPEVSPTYIQSGTNLEQAGGRIYQGVDGSTLNFRTLKVDSNLTLSQDGTSITLGLGFTPSSGDVSNGTNLGPQDALHFGVFKEKVGSALTFRSLASSSSAISLSPDSSDTQIIFSFNENLINLANLGGNISATRVTGLSPLATNSDYSLLSNKPTIPTTLESLSNVVSGAANGTILQFTNNAWTPTLPQPSIGYGTVKVGLNSLVATTANADVTLNAGSELVVTGDVLNRAVSYNLKPTGITAGTYTIPTLQVDTFGRIIGVQSGTPQVSGYIDPLSQNGDILYRAGGTTSRLPIGSVDQVLTVVNGQPAWRSVASQGGGTVTQIGVLAGPGINSDGGPVTKSGSITVGLKITGVAAGTYTNPTIAVDIYGRITQASSSTSSGGASGGSTVKINTGYGLQGGGDLTADRTLSLSMTGVTQGSYANPTIKVDAYGRILDITSGAGGGSGGGISSIGIVGNGGINVTGSPLTANGNITLTLTNTGVTAGQYGLANFQVNAQGRITAVNTTSDVGLSGNLVSGNTGETIIDPDGGLYFPFYSAAEIASKSSSVNTANKGLGKAIIDSTNFRILFATGESPTSAWAANGGTPTVTPT